MPTVLFSFKKTSDGGIMFHGFLAPNDKAADKMLKGHANVCPQFGPAVRDGLTLDHYIEVEELPEWDAEEIEEWLDELCGVEDDEEEDDAIDVTPGGGEPEPEED